MAIIKYSTSSYNILATGSCFTYELEPMKIEVSRGGDIQKSSDINIEFSFVEDDSKGKEFESKPSIDGNYLEVKIYNAKQGAVTLKPIFISQDDGNHKKAYLSFSVSLHIDFYLCNYTIFEEK